MVNPACIGMAERRSRLTGTESRRRNEAFRMSPLSGRQEAESFQNQKRLSAAAFDAPVGLCEGVMEPDTLLHLLDHIHRSDPLEVSVGGGE